MEANGTNYFKGVLLCQRPNEHGAVARDRPFCSRVNPNIEMGIGPTKHFQERKVRKRQLPVLDKHKQWLQTFKKQVKEKEVADKQAKQARNPYITKDKKAYNAHKQTNKDVDTQAESPNKSVNDVSAGAEVKAETSKPVSHHHGHNKKSAQMPAWAMTAEQSEKKQDEELDQLINFFETSQVKDYLDNDEVKKMLVDLKDRIDTMKNTDNGANWKQQQLRKYKNRQDNDAAGDQDKSDILSRASKGAQSVASKRTQQRVMELEKKKQEQQWDSLTTASEKRAKIDQQIAKNIADQVLRNYPMLKHHSNLSVRKLLEKEAKQQVEKYLQCEVVAIIPKQMDH